MSTINMQTMRYINLLDRISRVKTMKCFIYSNTIIFAVPGNLVSKAIGPDAINVRNMQESLGKKVKIIKESNGIADADSFLKDIVSPAKFKGTEAKNGQLILNAGGVQNKAILMGRNKVRYEELSRIVKDVYGLELRIM